MSNRRYSSDLDLFSPYLRMGPVNWTPRFHAEHLDAAGFQAFLRYVENNPVRAGAFDWPWSSPGSLHRP